MKKSWFLTFKKYFDYVYERKHDDIIDYKYLMKIFWDCMECHNYIYDYKWNE